MWNKFRIRWACFWGNHEWYRVERYAGNDIGWNEDRREHCGKSNKWVG
jgi:hypothetical protein